MKSFASHAAPRRGFIPHGLLVPVHICRTQGRLRKHVEAGGTLRVLTTTYTGSTEAGALDWLAELGADVRVSYDTTITRLHAKAWLLHRDSGFSTAYVGSSNLTHWAQATGLEWNVRISGARNRSITEKVAAVFESYWGRRRRGVIGSSCRREVHGMGTIEKGTTCAGRDASELPERMRCSSRSSR